ncbi:MAG: sulfotransferase family protein [Rubrobacteraceae bacterium]
MAEKPVALWAVPRSISTAFERIFVEREDFEVFHEPFAVSYYFSDERRSDRYPDEEPKEEHRYENVLAELTKEGEKPVFFKDMAYHTAGFMGRGFTENFRNSFLIRDPKQVLASFYKMWPDFTFEEAGYEQLHHLFQHAVEAGQESIVVDAADLAGNTQSTVAAYCGKLGIPFKSEALSWEQREVPEWEMWDEWHTEAQESTGIQETTQKEVTLPDELQETYELCLPYYESLREHRLDPAAFAEKGPE